MTSYGFTNFLKFENVKVGEAPPDGAAGNDYSGWTVVQPLSTYNIKPKGGNNVIQATNPEGASITIDNEYPGFITSFWFACYGYAPDTGILPTPCSVQVLSDTAFAYQGIRSAGTFDYSVNYTNLLVPGTSANMTKATIDSQYYGNIFYFNIISGAPGATLFLDNVVTEQQNNTCAGA